MSKDIRSFFTVLKKNNEAPQKPKKPLVLIDSDDDIVASTPEKVKKVPLTKRRAIVLSSDSEDEGRSKGKSPAKKQKISSNRPKKEEKPKLKLINLEALNQPIKQSEVKHVSNEITPREDDQRKEKPKKKSKKGKTTELGVHGDKDFEKTLEELDEDTDDTILLDNLDLFDKTIEDAALSKYLDEDQLNDGKPSTSSHTKGKEIDSKSVVKRLENKNGNKEKHINEDQLEPSTSTHTKWKEIDSKSVVKKHENKNGNEEKHKEEAKEKDDKISPKKRQRKSSESTPKAKKPKLEQADSGIDQDLENWDKRRNSAGLYVAYLNRGGPKHHGEKEYPKGKPDCFKGLTFLRTGVLDSLEGEEFENLVTDHGGKVVHGISKKVNYIVVGDQPGPAKLEKARKYNLPEMSEDEFLDMILVKSGMKPKFAVKCESEDWGIGGSEDGSVQSDKMSPIKVKKEEENQHKSKEGTSGKSAVEEADKIHYKSKEGTSGQSTVKEKSNLSKDQEKNVIADKSEDKSIKNKPKDEKSSSAPSKTPPDIRKEPVDTQTSPNTQPEASKKSQNLPSENLSLTDKYKPTSIKSIIGQQDNNSNMNKLKRWLENWFKNADPERRKKLPKPTLYNQYDGAYFKAALLSGPPGVGKTTTATLVAKELGFDIVEFNASDTRSKKLLHEEISQMMKSKSVAGFTSGQNNINQKRVLLMDEVDGMAGNEDRGGIAELINFIKTASFPIICMCNNRDLPKMRTLVNHCYALKYGKPNVAQVRGAMMSICFKEGLSIKPDVLAQLITGTGCDIRQTLNHLSMWSATEKSLSAETVQKESKNSQKDVVFGAWDVIKKVFNKSENKDMTLADKSRLFFYDYSFGPMFVQENYLSTVPECTGPRENRSVETLIRRHLASECLSRSDLIESKIRSTNNWSLLESQAFFSTVLPSHYLSGKMDQVRFPSWFGKNSQRNKSLRMVGELYSHARTSISGDKFSVRLDYAEPLMNRLITPLKEKQAAGIDDTLEVMKSYSLLRDDLTNLCDLMTSFFNRNHNPFDSVSSAVKAALTRKYNKTMVLSFAPPTASKKKKGAAGELEGLPGDEDEDSAEEETQDNIDADTLIKVKNKVSAKAGTSKAPGTKKESKPKGKSAKSSDVKGAKGRAKK